MCASSSGFRETHIRGYIEAIREIEQQLPTGTDEVGFDDIVVACGRKTMHMNYCVIWQEMVQIIDSICGSWY
ncbi:hypothetical protein CK203_096948 [Vitis vinifera]|uniref:Uncharacterized protein n=1 Tax=Vitis vinifera TaxID=29760 RepID=A0A438BTF6_VITVI|nr:hypothetical protein CK203_096948 [Vitis vinifera]